MHSPKEVSIVIPVFNRAHVIERALKSVWAQTHKNFRVVVVDDASTDNSGLVAEDFLKSTDIEFEIMRLDQNLGVSSARNRAIHDITTPWIAFLDSDDEWLPNKLEMQMQKLKSDQLFVSHTNEIWRRNGEHLNQHKKHQKKGGRILLDSLRMCAMSPSTVIVHKSVFDKVGCFREDFPACEDYELWLKICCQYEVSFVETSMTIKHGGHSDQLSERYLGMDFFRLLALENLKQNFSTFLTEFEMAELEQWIVRRRHLLRHHYDEMLQGKMTLRATKEIHQLPGNFA